MVSDRKRNYFVDMTFLKLIFSKIDGRGKYNLPDQYFIILSKILSLIAI